MYMRVRAAHRRARKKRRGNRVHDEGCNLLAMIGELAGPDGRSEDVGS